MNKIEECSDAKMEDLFSFDDEFITKWRHGGKQRSSSNKVKESLLLVELPAPKDREKKKRKAAAAAPEGIVAALKEKFCADAGQPPPPASRARNSEGSPRRGPPHRPRMAETLPPPLPHHPWDAPGVLLTWWPPWATCWTPHWSPATCCRWQGDHNCTPAGHSIGSATVDSPGRIRENSI